MSKQPFTWEAYQQALAFNPAVTARLLEVFTVDHLSHAELDVLTVHIERTALVAIDAANSLADTGRALREKMEHWETLQ